MQFYKYEPQFILQNSTYKLHNDRYVTDWTIHNNTADTVILNKTIKQAGLIDVATSKSQTSQLHQWEAPEVHRLERTAYKNTATENSLYNITSISTTGINANNLISALFYVW